jgi:hypothetical protein
MYVDAVEEQRLPAALDELASAGVVPSEVASLSEPLGFLVHDGGATSLLDAAYRFARHEPGADVVRFGTSSVEHLRANVRSISPPPLPEADLRRLHEEFGHLHGAGLDITDRPVHRASRQST